MTFPWKLLPLVAALALTACGGGGSSSPANSANDEGNGATPNSPSEPGGDEATKGRRH